MLLPLGAAAAIAGSLGYAFWRKAPLSMTTTIAVIAVFALTLIPGTSGDRDLVGYAHVPGGTDSPPWTLLTSMYFHLDLRHLLFNVMGLLLLAPAFEQRVGPPRFAILYLATGLVATAGFVLLRWGDSFLLLGASGAISGVFGAFARLYPRERVSLWLLFFPLPPTPVIILAFGYVVVSAILGLAGFFANIAWEAHILGLLAGYALARRVAALDLPMPAQRRPAALDLRPLEPLAVREDLRQILERIRAETVPDVRDAWIEEFAAKAPCPQCGRALLFKGRTLLSQCGWRTRL